MYLLRAFVVWLVLMAAESVHGFLRELFLAPYVGEFRARQIAVFSGALIILGVAYLFVRWIRAETTGRLIAAGVLWLFLTLSFELMLGRFVFGFSWGKLAEEYDVTRGALMPFGLVILTLSPIVAARLRRLMSEGAPVGRSPVRKQT